MDKLAIVVPCYNEEEVLHIAADALRGVLDDLISKEKIAKDSFVLFVNDGSKDRTWELIEEEHKNHPVQICGVKLAGNVGHQYALTAGLITAMDMSDVTVSIDADLQDDVAVIEEMIDKFHAGNDIVYGVRKERKTDTFFKRTTAQAFYKLMAFMGVKTIYNHADFRLMSKRAVEQFAKFKETNMFLRGMVPLIGYQSDSVYYDRKERVAGESKYPLKKMLALAFNGISSFSVKPISMIMGLGMSLAMSELSEILGIHQDVGMLLGIIIGVVGIVPVCLAYPLYNRALKKEREKIAPEILRLADELMKQRS